MRNSHTVVVTQQSTPQRFQAHFDPATEPPGIESKEPNVKVPEDVITELYSVIKNEDIT